MNLSGRGIIVTGANRGLGEAAVRRARLKGAHLVVAARDGAKLERVRHDLQSLTEGEHQRIVPCVADVSSTADVDRLLEVAVSVNGCVDVLVSSAGVYGPIGLAEDVDWDEWVEAVQINLLGSVLCCSPAVRLMRAQGGGKIVLMSGGGATAGLPRMSAYAASKAAVVRFAETLAAEALDAHIDVNAVAPGALNTRLLDQVLAAGPDSVGVAFYDRAVQQSKTGGSPLETPAELIAFLASPASDGLTGRLFSAVWAGGLATRLRPLTETIPKALIEVAGRPLILHQPALPWANGIEHVVVCLGYRGAQLVATLRHEPQPALDVDVVHDGDHLLGTAGALRGVSAKLGSAFFVLYGDSYLTCPFEPVQSAFEAASKLGLMTVFRNNGQFDRSNIVFRDGKILVHDKRLHTPDMLHIDYGLGILNTEALARVPTDVPYDLAALYADLLGEGQLAAYEATERFYEIGSTEGLEDTRAYLESRPGTAAVEAR
jgi:NAD(P)-dependent dehydrogenase (short-subunit alcohol dehydrogenase family)/choline kinase